MDPDNSIIIIICCLSALVIIFLLFVIGAIIVINKYKMYFDKRVNTLNKPTNLTTDDFDFLYSREFNFYVNGEIMRGDFYYQDYIKTPNKIVVVVPGYNVGQVDYMNLIAQLVLDGFLVYSYDAYGVNESEGDSIKSLSYPAVTLKAAMESLLQVESIQDFEFIILGHSNGAYAAIKANELEDVRISTIIAVSGFNSPVKEYLYNLRKTKSYWLNKIYKPLIYLLEKSSSNMLHMTCKYNINDNNGRELVLMHSKKDMVVPYSNSLNKIPSKNIRVKKITLADDIDHKDLNCKYYDYIKEKNKQFKSTRCKLNDFKEDSVDIEKLKEVDERVYQEILKVIK